MTRRILVELKKVERDRLKLLAQAADFDNVKVTRFGGE